MPPAASTMKAVPLGCSVQGTPKTTATFILPDQSIHSRPPTNGDDFIHTNTVAPLWQRKTISRGYRKASRQALIPACYPPSTYQGRHERMLLTSCTGFPVGAGGGTGGGTGGGAIPKRLASSPALLAMRLSTA